MKDKPRLEPTDVHLNSVGGQLKACDQFMAVTKHRNTDYRFNVIVIEGDNMINLQSRDVAADMGLVCCLEQVDASGDDYARIGLMKTEPLTIKLKAGAEPQCLITSIRVPFPLMDAIGRASGSRYMARLCAIGAYWGLSETIEDWTQE